MRGKIGFSDEITRIVKSQSYKSSLWLFHIISQFVDKQSKRSLIYERDIVVPRIEPKYVIKISYLP